MIIDDLIKLMPVPKNPIEIGIGQDWGRVTNLFGKPLPGDYMAFIDKFGSGEIGGWLTIFNPFSSNMNISLIEQFFFSLSSLSVLKEEFPETCPYPLMFEPGGLLPWGRSIDGDLFCWSTAGVSGKWRIVIIGRHSEPEEYSLPMCKFIELCIKGEIAPMAIPLGWNNENIGFVPFKL